MSSHDTHDHASESSSRASSSPTAVPLGFGGVSAFVGDHIAHFYKGRDQRFNVLGPYVASGLKQKDRCAVMSRPEVADSLCEWLVQHDVDVDEARADGRLILHPGAATRDDMHAVADRIETEARHDGHPFVRWAGDAHWAMDGEMSVCEMLRWEALYDKCSSGWDMLALCQFDLTEFSGDVIMDALRAHPLCVVGDVVVPNPFHETPEVLLDELAQCE